MIRENLLLPTWTWCWFVTELVALYSLVMNVDVGGGGAGAGPVDAMRVLRGVGNPPGWLGAGDGGDGGDGGGGGEASVGGRSGSFKGTLHLFVRVVGGGRGGGGEEEGGLGEGESEGSAVAVVVAPRDVVSRVGRDLDRLASLGGAAVEVAAELWASLAGAGVTVPIVEGAPALADGEGVFLLTPGWRSAAAAPLQVELIATAHVSSD